MFRQILIAVDESECAKRAALMGLAFAQKVGAKVGIAHVLQTPPKAFGITIKPETMKRYAEEVLEPWKQLAQKQQQRVKLLMPSGESASETIVETAKELGADLIVIGTHGREGLGRMFLGSVAERVSRLSPVPVMLVRQDGKVKPGLFEKILAPIDGSQTSTLALSFADQLALQTNAELRLLYVIPEIPMPVLYPLGGAIPFPNYQETYQALEQEATTAMTEALARCKNPKISKSILRSNQNRIAQVIVGQAKDSGCDLIVLGTHGRTGLDYWLLGSVAEGVSHHAEVPVLLVRAAQVSQIEPAQKQPLSQVL